MCRKRVCALQPLRGPCGCALRARSEISRRRGGEGGTLRFRGSRGADIFGIGMWIGTCGIGHVGVGAHVNGKMATRASLNSNQRVRVRWPVRASETVFT